MKKPILLALILLITSLTISVGVYTLIFVNKPGKEPDSTFVQNVRTVNETPEINDSDDSNPIILNTPNKFIVPLKTHTYQTFNNCGPATLSMILSFYGIEKTQKELGENMRPYQNPKGDNDDKTIFSEEFGIWVEKNGLNAITRVNGDIELLKKFTSSGFPVVVKTWLHRNNDIGHFRIVKGYDETQNVIIQDDSYEGPNRKISYNDFLYMWQPFNYNYTIVYPKEEEHKIKAILAEEFEEINAWKNALERAKQEAELNSSNMYPKFNMAASHYHLGEYEKTVELYESIQNSLPKRMLWYQIEPILAYQKLHAYDKVFEVTNNILENGNRAFSELYIIRGQVLMERGHEQEAKDQFELAVKYNKNYETTKDYLSKLIE